MSVDEINKPPLIDVNIIARAFDVNHHDIAAHADLVIVCPLRDFGIGYRRGCLGSETSTMEVPRGAFRWSM